MAQTSGETQRQSSAPEGGMSVPDDEPAHVEADGTLEMVDWRSGEFLVRDDVGHAFRLDGVANADEACRYIGLRVQAQGIARRVRDGSVRFEPGGAVRLVEMPRLWFAATSQDLDDVVRSVPGPDLDGGIDLTDEELASFLAAIRG